jgi:hypothetical protein
MGWETTVEQSALPYCMPRGVLAVSQRNTNVTAGLEPLNAHFTPANSLLGTMLLACCTFESGNESTGWLLLPLPDVCHTAPSSCLLLPVVLGTAACFTATLLVQQTAQLGAWLSCFAFLTCMLSFFLPRLLQLKFSRHCAACIIITALGALS